MSKRGFLSRQNRLLEPSWSCDSCGLYKNATSPKIEPYGRFAKGIMCIGEAPGKNEDESGKPWQGKIGRYLEKAFRDLGYDLFEDCISLNAANCAPYRGDKIDAPSDHEIMCCRDVKVKPAIEKYKPKVIILFGTAALASVVGDQWKDSLDNISRWRGFSIPDRNLNAWICPLFHPSYPARVKSREVSPIPSIWMDDLKLALDCHDVPLPSDVDPEIRYCEGEDVGNQIVDFVGDSKLISFDYETTGVKPHSDGHRIICVSVAKNKNEVIAAMFPEDPTDKNLDPFRDLLEDPKVQKMAHNMKYEETWSRSWLGAEVRGWFWDTMLAAHILDNRRRITGLKFQTYVTFGIADYNSEIEGYFKLSGSKEDISKNSKNRIESLIRTKRGRETLMKYCARDSIYQYNLAQHQMQYNDFDFEESYKLFHDGALAFQRAEEVGIAIDVEYCQQTRQRLTDEIAELKAKFERTKLWKRWRDRFKSKTNMNSNTQLGEVLYNVMGVKPYKNTASGKGSTDEEALKKLNMPTLDSILEMRKIAKIRDTYLLSWEKEAVKGVLRANFGLSGPTTYRSSCSDPNLQNVPKQDKRAYEICRSAIFPRRGHQFMEVDYSGVETRVAAMITGDQQLKYDVVEGDMHKDTAIEIFELDGLDRKHKGEAMLRQAAKAFVFSQFYGGRAEDSIPILLDQIRGSVLRSGVEIYDHLRDKKLVEFDDRGNAEDVEGWKHHLERVQDRFWQERYKKYNDWKTDNWLRYEEKGYIRFPTGFYYMGPASRNEVLNSIIQGSAFHILLWSFIRLGDLFSQDGFDTKLVGQIHDAILLDVNPQELLQVKKMVNRVMEKDVAEHWDWINIPLKVEGEVFDVDAPWVNGNEIIFDEVN